MKDFFTNPGLYHVGEKIVETFDHEMLLVLKTVFDSQYWHTLLDLPIFWLKKCREQDLSDELQLLWQNLINETKNTSLRNNVTFLLIHMHKKPPESFRPPLHLASKFGDLPLVWFMVRRMNHLFIEKHFESFENTPIHEAAKHGHAELIKILTPFTNAENAKDDDGNTPFDLASDAGHSEVVKLLLRTDKTLRHLI